MRIFSVASAQGQGYAAIHKNHGNDYASIILLGLMMENMMVNIDSTTYDIG
jgi:hypothetical protein